MYQNSTLALTPICPVCLLDFKHLPYSCLSFRWTDRAGSLLLPTSLANTFGDSKHLYVCKLLCSFPKWGRSELYTHSASDAFHHSVVWGCKCFPPCCGDNFPPLYDVFTMHTPPFTIWCFYNALSHSLSLSLKEQVIFPCGDFWWITIQIPSVEWALLMLIALLYHPGLILNCSSQWKASSDNTEPSSHNNVVKCT